MTNPALPESVEAKPQLHHAKGHDPQVLAAMLRTGGRGPHDNLQLGLDNLLESFKPRPLNPFRNSL